MSDRLDIHDRLLGLSTDSLLAELRQMVATRSRPPGMNHAMVRETIMTHLYDTSRPRQERISAGRAGLALIALGRLGCDPACDHLKREEIDLRMAATRNLGHRDGDDLLDVNRIVDRILDRIPWRTPTEAVAYGVTVSGQSTRGQQWLYELYGVVREFLWLDRDGLLASSRRASECRGWLAILPQLPHEAPADYFLFGMCWWLRDHIPAKTAQG